MRWPWPGSSCSNAFTWAEWVSPPARRSNRSCPFHSEKTPSFTVDSGRGLWHCFGCGEGGNIYHFIQKAENLPFPEAVEWLARKSGFNLRYEEMRPGEKKVHGLKMRLLEANAESAKVWHRALMK